MNYDESVFKEKANRRARRIWIIFAALLSANYGADVANHLRGTTYYIFLFSALLAASHHRGDSASCEGLRYRPIQIQPRDRLWHFLYICIMHNRITDCIHVYPARDQSSGSL